jgi:hypothetical protein
MKIQIISRRDVIVIAAIGIVLALGYIAAVLFGSGFSSKDVIEREAIDVNSAKLDLLQDDRLEDKKPAFDPALVDSRPLNGPGGRWEINASDAVTKLDVDEPRGSEVRLLELYPSYVAAAKQMRDAGYQVLPSINSLDGKAKQFDDGLMAAVMSAFAPSPRRSRSRVWKSSPGDGA